MESIDFVAVAITTHIAADRTGGFGGRSRASFFVVRCRNTFEKGGKIGRLIVSRSQNRSGAGQERRSTETNGSRVNNERSWCHTPTETAAWAHASEARLQQQQR